jgi:hypothetical protein
MATRALLRVLVGRVLAGCQRSSGGDDAARAQAAVAEFYTWYRPAPDSAEADMRVIRERRARFARALVAELRADSVARANSPNEII